jgi:HEAT repeat protein
VPVLSNRATVFHEGDALTVQLARIALTCVALFCGCGFCLSGYGQTDDVLHEIDNLKDPGWGIREAAARNLGKMGDPRAVPALIVALQDQDPRLDLFAADALAELRDPRAVEPLITLAKQTRNTEAADEANVALGEFKDARAVDSLIDTLNRTKEPWKEEKIASSLGRIGALAIPQLTAELKNPDPVISAHALDALGWINDPQATEALIGHLKDPDAGIREAAVTGLAGHAQAAGILVSPFDLATWLRSARGSQAPTPRDARAPSLLIEALKDPDSEIQCSAALGLGELKIAAAVDPMVVLLREPAGGGKCAARGSSITTLHQAIVIALGLIGDSGAANALINALADPDQTVRMRSADSLGKIRDERATMPLVALLDDNNPSVVRDSIRALAEIKDPKAVGPLIAALRKASAAFAAQSDLAAHGAGAAPFVWADPVLQDGTYALGAIGEPAVGLMIAATRNAEPAFRQRLMVAIGVTKDPSAVSTVILALGDADAGVRSAALQALAGMKDARAAAPFTKAWDLADRAARVSAIRVLCRNDASWAVGPVVAAMRDKDSGFASGCIGADATEGMKTPVVDSVIPMLNDADSYVRGIAARTLVAMAGPQRLLMLGVPANPAETRIENALEASLKRQNDAVICAADSYFVWRGEPATENALVHALNAAGNQAMAEYLVVSGNAKLEAAGRAWLTAHHEFVDSHTFGPMWGDSRRQPAA